MIKKNDFIEIEFTGTLTDSEEVFDTNKASDAKKANLDIKNLKPFILSVGHKMLPEGFEEDLIGKEVGKEYSVNIKPEKAFGKRSPQMIRMIPTKLFHQQNIDPQKGMQLSLDGQLVRVLSSSGGRTLVDFNNPLAGKEVTYTYNVLRTVDDQKERINALQEFLFKKTFDVDLKGKTATFKVEKESEPLLKMFAPKFEEILGMKIESKIVEKKSEEKTKEAKKKQKKEEEHDDKNSH